MTVGTVPAGPRGPAPARSRPAPARSRPPTPWPPPLSLSEGGKVGISGVNTHPLIAAVRSTLRSPLHAGISGRLGERAHAVAWRRGVYFLDWTYVVVPDPHIPGRVRYRSGRVAAFSPETRELPVVLDSGVYRALIAGTAPPYAQDLALYYGAIELVQPNAYAAPDHPYDRAQNRARLEETIRTFPQHVADGRLWPVYPLAALPLAPQPVPSHLLPPLWRKLSSLGALIPLNRTQRRYSLGQREEWARLACAYALAVATDPEFRALSRYGRLMIGGLNGCPIPRLARHVFAALLQTLVPDCTYWLLGQASWPVVNGLGLLDRLETIWTDSTWWILDSVAERIAAVADGLITMIYLGRGHQNGEPVLQTFATRTELACMNLRAMQAAVAGLWQFPDLPRELRFETLGERAALKRALLQQPLPFDEDDIC